jgi:regulator of replication initiation timing
MGILDEVKSIASTIQKIDNIELYRKILDLQAEITELVQENHGLRRKIADLEQTLAIADELRFERQAYWRGTDGPYCTNCWDNRQRLVRMLKCGNPAFSECPTCRVALEVNPELDV